MSDSPETVSTPQPAARSGALPSRGGRMLRNLRRQSRNWLTLERLREMGTTLALVVPLTLLIWVWAEREEIVEAEKMQFIIDVRSADPTKVMTIVNDEIGDETITATLSGPRAGLDAIRETLRDNKASNRLTIDVTETAEPGPDPIRISIGNRLNQQKLFEANGVTVEDTSPPTVEVLVDSVVERELDIKLPAELAGRVDSAEFSPKTVKVRGPERVITQLESRGLLKAELELRNQSEILNARPGMGLTLAQERIKPITATGVTIEPAQIVGGKLQMSQEERGVIRSMVVFVAKPVALESEFTVTVTPLTLTNVPVIGPADILRKLEADEIQPKPYALITIAREDRGKTQQERMPTFQQLPPGVRVDMQQITPLRFSVTGAEASNDARPIE